MSLEVKAVIKHVRVSSKKAVHIARVIQGRNATEALGCLGVIQKIKSARFFSVVLASAMANAEHNFNLDVSSLIVKRALVKQGPVLKRFMPAARGSAHPIRKKMVHLEVVLEQKV